MSTGEEKGGLRPGARKGCDTFRLKLTSPPAGHSAASTRATQVFRSVMTSSSLNSPHLVNKVDTLSPSLAVLFYETEPGTHQFDYAHSELRSAIAMIHSSHENDRVSLGGNCSKASSSSKLLTDGLGRPLDKFASPFLPPRNSDRRRRSVRVRP